MSESNRRAVPVRNKSNITTPGRTRIEERLTKTTGSSHSPTLQGSLFEKQIGPVWASTKVAAKALDISPNALRIMKCRGKIECRYFGKHLRFDLSQLHLLLRRKR